MSTDQHTAQAAELDWFKSSYSGTSGGDCVEVAVGLDAVYVRDSKVVGGGRCYGSAGRVGGIRGARELRAADVEHLPWIKGATADRGVATAWRWPSA